MIIAIDVEYYYYHYYYYWGFRRILRLKIFCALCARLSFHSSALPSKDSGSAPDAFLNPNCCPFFIRLWYYAGNKLNIIIIYTPCRVDKSSVAPSRGFSFNPCLHVFSRLPTLLCGDNRSSSLARRWTRHDAATSTAFCSVLAFPMDHIGSVSSHLQHSWESADQNMLSKRLRRPDQRNLSECRCRSSRSMDSGWFYCHATFTRCSKQPRKRDSWCSVPVADCGVWKRLQMQRQLWGIRLRRVQLWVDGRWLRH